MNITITKTSAQAKAEFEELKKKYLCPECKNIGSMGIYHTEHCGKWPFVKNIKVSSHRCSECGCEWEARE